MNVRPALISSLCERVSFFAGCKKGEAVRRAIKSNFCVPLLLQQACTTIVGAGGLVFASIASAQQAYPAPTRPDVTLADENGVNVLSGSVAFPVADVSIGSLVHTSTMLSYDPSSQPGYDGSRMPLEVDSFIGGLGYSDNRDYSHFNASAWFPRPSFQFSIAGFSTTFFINKDHSLQSFDGSALTGAGVTSWIAQNNPDGDRPSVFDNNLGIWTYTGSSGVRVEIDTSLKVGTGQFERYLGVATKVVYPSGKMVQMHYRPDCTSNARLQSVTQNDGLMLKYVYADTSCSAKLVGVIALDRGFDACNVLADSCALSSDWRRSSYSSEVSNGRFVAVRKTAAGPSSRATLDKWGRVLAYQPIGAGQSVSSYTYCQSYFTGIIVPSDNSAPTLSQSGSSAADADESYCGEQTAPATYYAPPQWAHVYNRIRTVTKNNSIWSYSGATKLAPNDSPYPRRYTITRPASVPTFVSVDTRPGGGLMSFDSPSQARFSYTDVESQRLSTAQRRGQPQQQFAYDARGNILSSGLATAGYDAACSNVVTCNKPSWVRDTLGNQTDFTYDPIHGSVVTETGPANASGVRPQKRYSYIQRYAWFRDASGSMTRSPDPIWLLSTERFCRTSSAASGGCAAANDEVETSYDYGPDSGPNNLLLRGIAVTADGQTRRTCYAYNKFGDKISETAPRAGLGACS